MKSNQYTEREQMIRKQAQSILKMIDKIHEHPHAQDTFLTNIEDSIKWIRYEVEETKRELRDQ